MMSLQCHGLSDLHYLLFWQNQNAESKSTYLQFSVYHPSTLPKTIFTSQSKIMTNCISGKESMNAEYLGNWLTFIANDCPPSDISRIIKTYSADITFWRLSQTLFTPQWFSILPNEHNNYIS